MQIATLNGSSFSSLGSTDPINTRTFRLTNNNSIIYYEDLHCQLFSFSFSKIPKYDAIDKKYLLISSFNSSLIVGFDTSITFNSMYTNAVLFELSANSTFTPKASIPPSVGGYGFISCAFFMSD